MLNAAWLVFKKDLLLELRTKELWLSTLLFVLLSMFVLAFTVSTGGQINPRIGVGLFWIITLFAATQMTSRLYQAELQNKVLEQWVGSPVDLMGLHLGKWAAGFIQVFLMGLAAWGLYGVFLSPQTATAPLEFIALIALFCIGIVSLGGAFSLLTFNVRLREAFFPLLLFPLMTPLLLGAVQVSLGLWGVEEQRESANWWRMMLAADILYFSMGLLMSDTILNEAI